MIISPATASTARPSRGMVTLAGGGSVGIRAASLLDVDQELIPEHADGRGDRARDGGPEGTDRGLPGRPGEAGGDVVAHVHQQAEIGFSALAALDAGQDLLQPPRPFPTG